MGSNMAENHPIAFRFAIKARERGARLIHIDPRFSRTSAMADTYVRIRSGSDIAFLGGLINYVLENELYFKEYVLNYTNATTIVDERFQDTEDLDGLFSGFDAEKRQYSPETWQYARGGSEWPGDKGGEAQQGVRGGEDQHDAQGQEQHADQAHDIGQAQR